MKDFSTSNLVGAVIPNRPCLISKTLQRVLRSLGEGESSARFTETERSRATSSIALILSLLLVSSCLAWDDDDIESKPFHQSTHERVPQPRGNIESSVIDYGYNGTYQANPTHRTSVIDFGGPKRLAQEDDYVAPKQLRTQIHQDPFENQNRLLRESTASLQRETERRQENNAIQQAKQEAYYAEMDREKCEMTEFLGGVYQTKFAAVLSRNSAITSEGYVFRSGNNFVTPAGIYTKTRNTYAGPGSFTTQTGNLFFGNKGTTIQAGGAFFTGAQSGYVVGPTCRNTSTWRSR